MSYRPEPLTMPRPDMADAPAETAEPGDLDDACRRILKPTTGSGRAPADELFWFRWITGHQVSFVIWRLMAHTTEVSPESVAAMAGYVRGYCAMLLYTGSCSPEVYQRVIRPSMYLRHNGFSGGWAPDYRPVRGLLRGRPSPWTEHPDAGELHRAIRLYQVVHGGIAAKLVPGGRSLLQENSRGRNGTDPAALGALYDNYFMTRRARVPRHEIVAQLVNRLVAVAEDVATHGLYPVAATPPGELRTAEVLDCERDLPAISYRVARSALMGERQCALG